MEWQAQQLDLVQELCDQHNWQRTRNPGIFVCSICWVAGQPGEQTAHYTIPAQAQRIKLPQELCSNHKWHLNRNAASAVCSICWKTGRPNPLHTVPEQEFIKEQALQQRTPHDRDGLLHFTPHPQAQQQDISQPQDRPPQFSSPSEETHQEKQTDQLAVGHGQGKKESEKQPKRESKWPFTLPPEWITLLATWVGILIATGGLFWQVFQFNAQQATNAQMQATQVAVSAAQTLDQEQQTTFDTYLDRMSDLLLTDHLLTAPQGSPVIAIAEARTVTALRDLDSNRRAQLVRFLWKAKLDTGNSPVVSLNAALLSATTFQHALLYDINFSKTLLIGSTFDDCNLSGAIFTEAALPGALLNNVNLAGASMSGANLYGASLKLASLNGANLADADLHNAKLRADDLTQTNLTGADLTGADLTNAILEGANLSGDDLSHSNLSGADLAGADLKGARITPAQLKLVVSLQGTIMPDGSKHS